MKSILVRLLTIFGSMISLFGLFLLTHLADSSVINLISVIIQRPPKPTWPHHLNTAGIGLFVLGGLMIFFDLILFPRLRGVTVTLNKKIAQFENQVDSSLCPYLDISDQSNASVQEHRLINWQDILVVLFFLAAALFLFLSSIQGDYPHILMGGDGGNIVSFAAALDHPDYFKGDALLNNPENISIYSTVNIALIRWLNRYTHDYGLAFNYLLIPQIFLQLLGFYILGRILLKRRSWAFLFTLIVSMPYAINLQETWGVNLEPVSRFNFQALLPYLLALAYLWKAKPQRWPWVMVLSGLLVFVHPVSTPAWGLALWLGFIPFIPKGWSRWKRVGIMLALGVVFLLVASPFVLNYMTHHMQGKSADYKLVYHVIAAHFPENLLNVPAALSGFLSIAFRSGILPLSLLGLVILWLMSRHDRSPLKLLLFWAMGILLASVFLPWVEQSIERFYRIIPIETELVRGIRYFVFFMLIFSLWPLAELYRRLKSPVASNATLAIGIIMSGLWMAAYHPNTQSLASTFQCFSQAKLVCSAPNDDTALIEFIRDHTPQEARFFASFSNSIKLSNALPVRSTALHSLVYTFKDRGLMVYSNNKSLTVWDETYHAIEYIHHTFPQDFAAQFPRYLDLALSLGADYLIINFPPPPDIQKTFSIKLVYQNNSYAIYQLNGEK